VHFQQSARGEVRHSFFRGTRAGASLSYGVLLNMASASLVEDNAFEGIYAPILVSYGACGNVIAYNYFTNMVDNSTVMAACAWFHAGHASMNLLEGNYGNQIRADYFHGSSGYNTIFRNTMTGWEPDNNDNLSAINITVTNRYWNIAGNVLGKAGFHHVADSLCTSAYVPAAVYEIGWNNNSYSLINDPATVATLYRHGNFDVANNAVVWNSTNADHVIPSSLYLSGRPAWFGDRPWPPFDPTAPTMAAVTNLPAGYRFVYGSEPPAANLNPRLPAAVANVNTQAGAAPLSVSFSGAGSHSPQGVSLSYYWSFGDGSIATSSAATHVYQTPGTYRAQLTVSDGQNVARSRILPITVTNSIP
jgi:PKD repeat protein